jgi:hypothetical protein
LTHPNKLVFEGCLGTVDIPTDKAPEGARGHRIVLTRKAAEIALPGLIGMAVNYKTNWGGHDVRQKCGIITDAHFNEFRIMVSGFIYAKDFPEFRRDEQRFSDGTMGMSYELDSAHIKDMRRSIWEITKVEFIGAAILLKSRAAYRSTSFQLLP